MLHLILPESEVHTNISWVDTSHDLPFFERLEYQSNGRLNHVHGILNINERNSIDSIFNHVCSERCQIKENTVRASNDKDYQRVLDISRMSAQSLIDNPNLIAEFRQLVGRVFMMKWKKRHELLKNIKASMKYHAMDIFYTFTANSLTHYVEET